MEWKIVRKFLLPPPHLFPFFGIKKYLFYRVHLQTGNSFANIHRQGKGLMGEGVSKKTNKNKQKQTKNKKTKKKKKQTGTKLYVE
jgi:hypothetical protein